MDLHNGFLSSTVQTVLLAAVFVFVFAIAGPEGASAADAPNAQAERMKLPEPVKQGGKPLMEALSQRKSSRSFAKEELSVQQLSDILWAAFGQNREDGKRTIPTARNRRNMVVYAALPSGVWRYVPESNELVRESAENLTKTFGAPCTLGYAVEGSYGGMHAGSAYQNVGLYCASAGLGNVVKASGVDTMKKYVDPPSGHSVVIIQSIGRM